MKALILASFATLALAQPAQAELIFFANGRSMSVKDHRVEADALVLSLRGGGEVRCPASTVVSIAEDEVPDPQPASTVLTAGLSEANQEFPSPAPRPEYAKLVDRISAEQGIDPRLVKAVIQVESDYRHDARSPKGAMGLMQLMPATARQYDVRNPYDPAANIEGGVKHLRSLMERFPLAVALAAYNAGEAAVERFRGIPPYPETRSYVSRILQILGQ